MECVSLPHLKAGAGCRKTFHFIMQIQLETGLGDTSSFTLENWKSASLGTGLC